MDVAKLGRGRWECMSNAFAHLSYCCTSYILHVSHLLFSLAQDIAPHRWLCPQRCAKQVSAATTVRPGPGATP